MHLPNVVVGSEGRYKDMEHLGLRPDKGSNKSNYEGLMMLTTREQQVLEMVCEGMSNEEIAREFGIHVLTVKHYLKKIYEVLDTNRRHTVIIRAVKTGMVRPAWVTEIHSIVKKPIVS